jgi:hypothetical protein
MIGVGSESPGLESDDVVRAVVVVVDVDFCIGKGAGVEVGSG